MTLHLFFRFAYAHWLYIAIPLFILILYIRRFYSRQILYQYPLVGFILHKSTTTSLLPVQALYWLRFLILSTMLLLLAKPQLVDQKSKITVEGVDIMLVLDVSGSMALFDDMKDNRSRLDIAKEEAINFIKKRHNDAIGLVIFGNYAVTSCPLTFDKTILESMISSIFMSEHDPIHQATVISQSIITAARRLQKSQTKSKIIILLTDGEPSSNDLPIQEAIYIAKLFGIKVYTIGIGSHGTSYLKHKLATYAHPTQFNTELLEKVSQETGGKFFNAKKSQDVAKVYNEIDRLEKSKIQNDVYTKYYDYFIPIVFGLLMLIFFELIISTYIWAIL